MRNTIQLVSGRVLTALVQTEAGGTYSPAGLKKGLTEKCKLTRVLQNESVTSRYNEVRAHQEGDQNLPA